MLIEGHPINLNKGGLFMRAKESAGLLGERALRVVDVLAAIGVAVESMVALDLEDGVKHPLDTVDE
jgi:hypothetical protein